MTDSLIQFINRDVPTYCYGAGNYGKVAALYLRNKGVEISGFIQTEKGDCSSVLGFRVYSLAEVIDKARDANIVVCVGVRYREEIVELLAQNHITGTYIMSADEYIEMHEAIKYSFPQQYVEKDTKNIIFSGFYHRVAKLSSDPWKMAITPECFEEHLKVFQDAFPVIRFDEPWEGIKGKRTVITFDDGYYDFYKYAFPLLEKYETPATIFISTRNIGKKREFWWDQLERILWHSSETPKSIVVGDLEVETATENARFEALPVIRMELKTKYSPEDREIFLDELEAKCQGTIEANQEGRTMTEQEIVELSKSKYITIGAHTVSHASLPFLNEDEQRNEIIKAKERLEELIDKPVTVFSYPFGNYDESSVQIAKELFYRTRTIVPGMKIEEPALIPGNDIGSLTGKELSSYLRYYWNMHGND